jgi:RNA polymerase sigma factor (TIGR02999 family)
LAAEAAPDDLDALWTGYARGEAQALDRLLALHYDAFRGVARRVLNGDARVLQIQPTDLAHEAALRILRLDRMTPRGRTHFLALSARVMRQTLIDEVRRHRAGKRNAPAVITLWRQDAAPSAEALDLEALDMALTRLATVDADLATLVEQRFFAGLTIEEISLETGVSESSVKRRWRLARTWLANELGIT